MPKTVHFVSGLPRSCSTLLCNILAQNPRVHATATSPMNEISYLARGLFKSEAAKAWQPMDVEKMFDDYNRAGILAAFDSLTDRPVVIDKSRSWVGQIDQTYKMFPDAKILVPVRDVRGIICSMEKIRREHPAPFASPEANNAKGFTTMEKRAQGWLNTPPVGIAIERVFDAASRFKSKLFFVNADKLTQFPQAVMDQVWDYLGEPRFVHDFTNVEQYTHEHETGWPYGQHLIQSNVKPLPRNYEEILGKQLSDGLSTKFSWINDL